MKYIRILLMALSLGSISFASSLHAMPSTEVSLPSEEQPEIAVRASEVGVENPTSAPIEIAVFSITGTMVKSTTLDSGDSCSIELPSGYYIIKAGNLTRRVAVK